MVAIKDAAVIKDITDWILPKSRRKRGGRKGEKEEGEGEERKT